MSVFVEIFVCTLDLFRVLESQTRRAEFVLRSAGPSSSSPFASHVQHFLSSQLGEVPTNLVTVNPAAVQSVTYNDNASQSFNFDSELELTQLLNVIKVGMIIIGDNRSLCGQFVPSCIFVLFF
jgi:hypothetical protein